MKKSVELVLERLGRFEQRNGSCVASCPAHEDAKPSLSIKEGEDGKALLHCFAGCEVPEIVAALGLEMGDLFPPSANGHRNGHKRPYGRPTATWGARDASGELQAEHVRFDRPGGKSCFWRLPGASGWGLKGRKTPTLPLYRSELVQEWPEDVPLVVVEGEKAADALAAVYPSVVGTVTGAEGTPGPEVLEVLRGRRVVLWPDNDDAGRRHMERVAAKLTETGIAADVRIFEWAGASEKGDDAADHPAVRSGSYAGVDELLGEMAAAAVWEPELSSSSSLPYRENDDDEDAGGSGGRLAVKGFRALPKPDGPRQFLVEDLVPERFVTTIYGEGGSSKSMLALSIALGCARGDESWLGFELKPGAALFVDWELDEEEQGRRARQLARAHGDAEPPEDLFYLCAVGHRTGEVVSAALAACEAHGIGLVVLDSAGMAMEGDPLAGHDAIRFFRELGRFRACGVTVLLVDHQGKTVAGESYQSKTAYGSVYKGNLSRSRIQVEAKERGASTLGVVLRHNKSNFSGLTDPFKVRLTFTEEVIRLEREDLEEEELAEERTLNAPDRVRLALEACPAFPDELAERTDLAPGTVNNCLTRLKKRGEVEHTGETKGRAKQVRLSSSSSSPHRESDGDDATPLSSDLKPGEISTLAELRARREARQGDDGAFE